ncbi:hypothetical protein [Rhizobium johnstonii]|uniref:hypothetical protein n=1 Tax=Rhizobium johnstonii TaxID=3019933 RepID=UPI003F98AE62
MSQKAALSELILRNVEEMAFPPTQIEADALADVLALPRVTVTRPPKNDLLKLGMVPYNCHVNCAEYVASDPEELTRHVWGWIILGSDLILHSVVERNGLWRCLTPQLIEVAPTFTFIPDPEIEWVDTAEGYRQPFRGGVKLPDALRKNPEDHIRMRDRFRELLSSGMSPIDARAMVDGTLGAELRAERT